MRRSATPSTSTLTHSGHATSPCQYININMLTLLLLILFKVARSTLQCKSNSVFSRPEVSCGYTRCHKSDEGLFATLVFYVPILTSGLLLLDNVLCSFTVLLSNYPCYLFVWGDIMILGLFPFRRFQVGKYFFPSQKHFVLFKRSVTFSFLWSLCFPSLYFYLSVSVFLFYFGSFIISIFGCGILSFTSSTFVSLSPFCFQTSLDLLAFHLLTCLSFSLSLSHLLSPHSPPPPPRSCWVRRG